MLFYIKIQAFKNTYSQIPDELTALNAFEHLVRIFTSSFIITIYCFVMSICLARPSLWGLSELVFVSSSDQ